MNKAGACLFEFDPSLIGRVLGIELPQPIKVTMLNVVIPDPKTMSGPDDTSNRDPDHDLGLGFKEVYLDGFRGAAPDLFCGFCSTAG